MSGTVTDRDRGARKRVKALSAPERTIVVGVQGKEANASHDDSGALTVGEIAAIHELGLGVPMRSWLRGWLEDEGEKINNALRRAARQIAAGKLEKDQAVDILGALFVGWIQQRISAGIAPALAEETIQRKGSSIPLIDTGQVRSAITWLIEGRPQRS